MSTDIKAKNQALKTIGQMLVKNKNKLAVALPRHITADRMIRVTLNSLTKNKALLSCTIESLWEAIIEASTYGWEIGGPVAQAYLVPFKNTKTGKSNATLIPGYRGLMDLARRSGDVKNIAYGVVHVGDRFIEPEDPLDPVLIHQHSSDSNRKSKPVTHVWCGYGLTNGGRIYCIMTFEEIESHKARFAKGWKKPDSAWATSWESMAIKTVLKRPILDGRIPLAAEHQRLVNREVVDGSVEGLDVTSTFIASLGDEPSQYQKLPPPDTAEPAADPGEITADEEWELFSSAAKNLFMAADDIAKINAADEKLNDEYITEDQAEYIHFLSAERRKQIRGRGEYSNQENEQEHTDVDSKP